MSGVNKVIVLGRLGQDPEVKTLPSGSLVAQFSVATSETFTDKNNQRQERTEWHRVVVFGKLAQICGEYLKKGRQVYLEGRLQTRSWDDANGNKRYQTEIVAQNLQFIGNNNAGAGSGAGNYAASASMAAPAASASSMGAMDNSAHNTAFAQNPFANSDNPFAQGQDNPFNLDDEIPF